MAHAVIAIERRDWRGPHRLVPARMHFAYSPFPARHDEDLADHRTTLIGLHHDFRHPPLARQCNSTASPVDRCKTLRRAVIQHHAFAIGPHARDNNTAGIRPFAHARGRVQRQDHPHKVIRRSVQAHLVQFRKRPHAGRHIFDHHAFQLPPTDQLSAVKPLHRTDENTRQIGGIVLRRASRQDHAILIQQASDKRNRPWRRRGNHARVVAQP